MCIMRKHCLKNIRLIRNLSVFKNFTWFLSISSKSIQLSKVARNNNQFVLYKAISFKYIFSSNKSFGGCQDVVLRMCMFTTFLAWRVIREYVHRFCNSAAEVERTPQYSLDLWKLFQVKKRYVVFKIEAIAWT